MATIIPGVRPLAEIEKEAILDAMRKSSGDKVLAAHALGIGKTTLYRKLELYASQKPKRKKK